jgi:N-methylhydantoinase A
VPSTPADPTEAIERGLRALQSEPGYNPATVGYLGHGTTVATNTVIQRKGARAELPTTKEFRDVLVLGCQARPSIYDCRVEKPPVLILRDRRWEVIERIDAHGRVETTLEPVCLAIAVAPPPVITATLRRSRPRLAPLLDVSRMQTSDV